jgi:predicted PurR-regulated permease PerM
MADPLVVRRSWGRRSADTHSSAPLISTVLQVVLVVVAVLGALWLVYELGTIILLLVFSILFAYLVAPLVAFVERRLVIGRRRRELSRGVAIGIAYLVIVGAIALLFAWLAPYVTDAVKQAPQRTQTANGRPLGDVSGWLRFPGVSASMIDGVVSAATSAIDAGARRIATAFVHLAAFLPWLVLIPILSFFLLKDAQALTQATMRLLPERWRSHAPTLLNRIDTALAAYIRAQLVACVVVGAIVGVGLTALRVPFGAMLGVAAGIAEFVPLAGPLAIALISAGIAALRAPIAAVWVLLFLGVLRVLEDYVIYPRLVGSTVHLRPLAVILAVLAGGELGGVVGVILSVPFLAIASAVYRYKGDDGRSPLGLNRPTPREHGPESTNWRGPSGLRPRG